MLLKNKIFEGLHFLHGRLAYATLRLGHLFERHEKGVARPPVPTPEALLDALFMLLSVFYLRVDLVDLLLLSRDLAIQLGHQWGG
ncbi:hypothetical protein D3C87_1980920 [compost metagenome]